MSTKRMAYFVILLVIIVFGCTDSKISENEDIARSFGEAWSTHDVDRLICLFAEDCLYEEVPSDSKYRSKAAIAEYVSNVISGVPDTELEIVSVMASDSMAMIEWIWKGTNTVGWPSVGIPATDKYFEARGASIMKIENGLIKRNSDYWDWNSFLKSINAEY